LKARFIFNPHSGSNRRNPHLRDRAKEFIAQNGWDATVVSTERPRHATELARQAVDEGCTLVVAIGGDGTMNEVACALIDSPTCFGLIPCGSGNGLGRHLGIRRPGRGAFQTLLNGRPLAIDTGMVNTDPFFCVAGTGFESVIASQFATLTSRGFSGYLRTGIQAWRTYRPERYVIHHAQGHRSLHPGDLQFLAVRQQCLHRARCLGQRRLARSHGGAAHRPAQRRAPALAPL